MFSSAWNDKSVADGKAHRALRTRVVSKGDIEAAIQNQKELVGVFVDMPHVFPLDVRDSHVVVVDLCDDSRAVDLIERGQGVAEIDGNA